MTALQELFTNHKLALEACGINATVTSRFAVSIKVRDYAYLNNVGDFAFDSIETLLGLIEAKCKAEAPLTDEEIEAMKWRSGGYSVFHHEIKGGCVLCHNDEEAEDAVAAQHACIDRLAAEIRRLRKVAGRGS